MSKYKTPLPKPGCTYTEFANFCLLHGAQQFLGLYADEESNKKKESLTKKYPELWQIYLQQFGEDERLNYYRKEWQRRKIQDFFGYLIAGVFFFLMVLPAILEVIAERTAT